MSQQQQEYEEEPIMEEEDGNTTTVQFIAVAPEEHERMVREGELPETIQGADVQMTIGGTEVTNLIIKWAF